MEPDGHGALTSCCKNETPGKPDLTEEKSAHVACSHDVKHLGASPVQKSSLDFRELIEQDAGGNSTDLEAGLSAQVFRIPTRQSGTDLDFYRLLASNLPSDKGLFLSLLELLAFCLDTPNLACQLVGSDNFPALQQIASQWQASGCPQKGLWQRLRLYPNEHLA